MASNIDDETRAEWFYELAMVSTANKDYCDAIAYAREAIAYKSDYGKAYLTLGDAIIYSRDNLGDDFEQRTAFWVAADKYTKAKTVDPSVAADANKKMNDYARPVSQPRRGILQGFERWRFLPGERMYQRIYHRTIAERIIQVRTYRKAIHSGWSFFCPETLWHLIMRERRFLLSLYQ